MHKKKPPTDPRQQSIDFSRAEQLGLLQRLQLPNTPANDGVCVRPIFLKAVLNAIDNHGRGRTCYVKHETLAAEVNCSLHQAKRATQALESLSLIAVERRRTPAGPTCNHYTVVWTEIAARIQADQSSSEGTLVTDDQSSFPSDQSSFPSDQSSYEGPYKELPKEAHKEPPPPAPVESWDAAAAELNAFGLVTTPRLIAAARSAGETAEAFLDRAREAIRIATDPLNARKLEHPQRAVAWYLANGTWPVEGIRDGIELALSHAAARQARNDQEQSRTLYAIVRAGRKARISDETIRDRVRRELPLEFCEAQGW